jgi:hypothetical protein
MIEVCIGKTETGYGFERQSSEDKGKWQNKVTTGVETVGAPEDQSGDQQPVVGY